MAAGGKVLWPILSLAPGGSYSPLGGIIRSLHQPLALVNLSEETHWLKKKSQLLPNVGALLQLRKTMVSRKDAVGVS